MHFLPALSAVIRLFNISKYPLFFLGSLFEGTIVMLTGGVLLKLGDVDFWPVYVALVAGDILSDIAWYVIGYFGARPFMMRWGKIFNATPAVIEKLEEKFKKYHLRILIVSKLTMGLGIAAAILATAGMLRVSFARFATINVLGSFVWVGFVIFVGYTFGNVLEQVPEQYQIAFVLVLITVFFFGLRHLNARLAQIEW